MTWHIPRTLGTHLDVRLEPSTRIYLLGPNGCGKSALIQHLALQSLRHPIQWISAHRRNWLESGTINLTPAGRKRWASAARDYVEMPNSRWLDHSSESQQSAILFDLVAQENERARSIARQVDGGDVDAATCLSSKAPSPFATLNELLARGNLSVTVENSEGEELIASNRDARVMYDIAKMSDGERSAVMLAAHVLTAQEGTVFLVDEPERHLHRAIIEPLLSAVFSKRPDCSFVIATHEIALPANDPGAVVLLVRSCDWEGELAKQWDIDVLPPDSQLPESLRRAILGARKQVLFVEGTANSLDCRLYEALFPTTSVLPIGNSRAVQEAVRGLRETEDAHSVRAFGAVDGDDRSAASVEKLETAGIFPIDATSIEGLYYCSASIAAVARRQARALQRDHAEMQASAIQKALRCLDDAETSERMVAKRSERLIRQRVLTHLPSWRSLQSQHGEEIAVTVASPVREERNRYRQMIADEDFDGLVKRYPIRESRAFDAISEQLRCRSRHDYCQIVVGLIVRGNSLGDALRARIPTLANAVKT